mmetsp:Transcript_3344/g.4278  ORF Transcript_3344/g.4278 Transcript_3344/m.4278 type:complete len:788 (+) Transcript_3344:91-2454(+)|eukprot:CAMPEP_0172513876 /NCGR_PEP_ID=MMETSP1066-20121228/256161_1 /TAXON_ID=671091 /ORGANISM="Coscinodiscus wailesii, Strain CCMP2513" /LENGTH=787 /DNA_ID=CAMNT_0013294321 /DNA_START=88 /DNA_END=2451 /DNA_ORIENTATION=-
MTATPSILPTPTDSLSLEKNSPSIEDESKCEMEEDQQPKCTPSPSPTPGDDGDDSNDDSEEEFMQSLERQEEKAREEYDETHKELPQAKEDAPVLVRATIDDGEPNAKKMKQEGSETVKDDRGNQLDFLLSKATEYSNFIATDLEELQRNMAEQAAQAEAKKSKKRKRGKSKEGAKKLAEAQSKHASSSLPIFIQPPNLAPGCILKDYQLEGVRWMTSLYENGVSGILADEMGLGKTIQVISVIAHLRCMKVTGPFIVVAPLATLPNWVREFQKWLPDLPIVRLHGSMDERVQMLQGPLNPKNKRSPDFPAIVTSYEVAIKEQAKLNKIGEFTYLVVDEGQRLKNHRCTLIQSLKKIRASNRLLLSGTPIQNNLDELWSLLNFVNPQIFDDLSVFQSWFGFRDIGQKYKKKYTKEEDVLKEQREKQTVTKLHEILRPFLLRRIKKDVLTDMPPKKEVVVYAGMSKLQSGYANLIEQGTLRDILLAQGIENARKLSQTNKTMNHRKNSNHPFLFGEPLDRMTGIHVGTARPDLLIKASGKFALLDRMLTRLFRDKHQVLIFSQMTEVLNVMEDYLLWRNWKYCRIDGNTKIDERQQQMDMFNAEKTAGENGTRNDSDDRHFVFLLSTRAGGLGINLATADTCIIFDSDWNPHQDSQAMDRCHRIGQTRPVAVYRLLTTGSVDIEMMEKQISKKKLERMTIAGGDFRKAGSRSRGAFNAKDLGGLLEDDIKDLQSRGGELKIDEEEFERIMDRERLFAEGKEKVPLEGKMYDILDDSNNEDMLGAMNAK